MNFSSNQLDVLSSSWGRSDTFLFESAIGKQGTVGVVDDEMTDSVASSADIVPSATCFDAVVATIVTAPGADLMSVIASAVDMS